MGQPILVAVDFSKYSENALVWACEYAQLVKESVLVLHVVHDLIDEPGYYKKESKHLLRSMSHAAEEMLQKFLKKMATKYPAVAAMGELKGELIGGLPPTRIVERAKKRDVQLIVMGSHGRTGLKHLLLGSVAERVVQLSPIPVTVVKNIKAKKAKP